MRRYLTLLAVASCVASSIMSCTQDKGTRHHKGTDSVSVCVDSTAVIADSTLQDKDSVATKSVEENRVEVKREKPSKIDTLVNEAARFYAGLSRSGIEMSDEEQAEWDEHSKQIRQQKSISFSTLSKVNKLVTSDMSDLREKCDFVFYPFSGPDFLYPITIFPDADTYFMVGLEPAGSICADINKSGDYYKTYSKSLNIYMRSSFFRTLSMKNDLDNEEIDGTVPVISMLMALKDCNIVSISYKKFTDEGGLEDSKQPGKLAEIQFTKKATPDHVQTLYYLSTNLHDSAFNKYFAKFIATTFPQHQVATYLKAASYMMYEDYFSKVRTAILDYSFAVLQDDSGMPYRFFKEGWDVTLYGKYVHPLKIFKERDYQLDLLEKYETDSVRALPFRIGYNNPSNWMCARKLSNTK